MDGCKIEVQIIDSIFKNNIELDLEYNLKKTDNIEIHVTEEVLKSITTDTYNRCNEHFEKIIDDKLFLIKKIFNYEKKNVINYPIPFRRIITTAHNRLLSINIEGVKTDLSPDYILDGINKIEEKLFIKNLNQGMRFLHILLRLYLNPKKLIFQYHFTKEIFDYIVVQIIEYFNQAIAQPGEMVGIIAAQSIGEPTQQLTLNTKHSAGAAGKGSANMGVSRIQELLHYSKNIKTVFVK
jgi:DNA-directed RNA polymerase II subunit RPB1